MSNNLLTDIVAGAALAGVFGTGLGMLIRITRRWTIIEENLKALVEKVTTAISESKNDYLRTERRVDRNEDRINRHEEWHAQQIHRSDTRAD